MSTQANFSVPEWDLLRHAPFFVGMAVVAASPSGPIGLLQESAAVSRMVLEEAAKGETELLKALGEDLARTMSMPKLESHESAAVREAGLKACREAGALLAAKATPEEYAEVRGWLLETAQKVAEAAKEGGFLGFGGTPVSEEEKHVLAEIAAALNPAS